MAVFKGAEVFILVQFLKDLAFLIFKGTSVFRLLVIISMITMYILLALLTCKLPVYFS